MPPPRVRSPVSARPVPLPLPGYARIRGSVGQGGANRREDVRVVQMALNAVVSAAGGPVPSLAEDGYVGPKTVAAIRRFQTMWTRVVDGRVDPRGPTLRALNGLAGVPAPPAATAGAAMGFAPSGPVPAPPPPSVDEIRAFFRWNHAQTVVMPQAALAIWTTLQLLVAAQVHIGGQLARGPGPPPAGLRAPGRLAFLFVAKHFRLHEREPSASLLAVQMVTAVFARCLDTFRARTVTTPLGPRFDRMFALARIPPHIVGKSDIAYVGAASAATRPPGPTGFQVPGTGGLLFPEISDGIYLLPGYDAVPHLHVPVLVHELAHLCGGPTPDHWVVDMVFPTEAAFQAQPREQRLRNVQCYEYLAIEAYGGTLAAGMLYPRRAFATVAPFSKAFGQLDAPPAPAGGTDPLAWPAGMG